MEKNLDYLIDLIERHHLELQRVKESIDTLSKRITKIESTIKEIDIENTTDVLSNIEYEISSVRSNIELLQYKECKIKCNFDPFFHGK
jgi:archaellum component FlaC